MAGAQLTGNKAPSNYLIIRSLELSIDFESQRFSEYLTASGIEWRTLGGRL